MGNGSRVRDAGENKENCEGGDVGLRNLAGGRAGKGILKNWVNSNYKGDGSQRGSKEYSIFDNSVLGNSGIFDGSESRVRDAVSDILKNTANNFGSRSRKTYSRVSNDNYSNLGGSPAKTLKSKKSSTNSQ